MKRTQVPITGPLDPASHLDPTRRDLVAYWCLEYVDGTIQIRVDANYLGQICDSPRVREGTHARSLYQRDRARDLLAEYAGYDRTDPTTLRYLAERIEWVITQYLDHGMTIAQMRHALITTEEPSQP